MPLLAEVAEHASNSADGRVAMLMAFSTILGTGVAWVFFQARSIIKDRQERADKKEVSVIAHQKIYIDRLDKERDELCDEKYDLQSKLDEKKAECIECKASYRVAKSHIRYLERVLAAKQISYEQYEDPPTTPTDETAEHRSLATAPTTSPSPNTPLENGT